MDEVPAARGTPVVWGVAALLLAASDALATRFGACLVRGELSGYARAASGHAYFTLKDADGYAAALRCVMFRRAATLLDFHPQDGQQVELRGRVAVYEARGELQFVVEAMRRAGAGALYERFLRLRAQLAAEGLFDTGRKRPIAAHPRAIGIVSSTAAAALRDVIASLARRAPQVRVVIYPAAVQGSEAPPAIVQAIALAGRRAEVDTLILCRGGGSLEDLWAFNDERVVRAVAASVLPVVAGIGHETDVTLADLAADLRAATPTAAAELAAPARAELERVLDRDAAALTRAVQSALDRSAQRLDGLAARLSRPASRVLSERQRVDAQGARAGRAFGQALRMHRARLDGLAARLHALGPPQVLARGYAWVADADGRAVTSAARLSAGQTIRAHWADGSAGARVLDVDRAGKPGSG